MSPNENGSDSAAGDDRELAALSSEVSAILPHLYRGEMDRTVSWRARLDSTTNWAVTVIAAILAYAFSSEGVAHAIILVGMLIGTVFLFIEARRFRRYDVWRTRVRSLQENLFAYALDPAAGFEHRDWRRQLSADYRAPDTRMPLRRALAHRLRRVYLPLLAGLFLVWLFRLNGADEPLVAAATVSNAPGWVVFGAVIASFVGLVALAFWPDASAMAETDGTVDRGDLDREE